MYSFDDMIISRTGMTRLTSSHYKILFTGQGLNRTVLGNLLFFRACCVSKADIGAVSPPSSQCRPTSLCHCGGVARGRSLTNTGCVRGWALRRSLTSTTISARVCRVILLVRGRVGLCHRDTGLPRHHTGASRLCPVRSLHNYSRSLTVTSYVATTTDPAFFCRPMRNVSGETDSCGQAAQVARPGSKRQKPSVGTWGH